MRIILLIVLLFSYGISYSEQTPQRTNTIEKEQVPHANPEQTTKAVPNPTAEFKPITQSIITEVGGPVNAYHAENGEKKPDENWWNKIWTDPVATFTALLFLATLALWLSTRSLVKGAEETARKELRAYVATDDIFFVSYESATQLSVGLGGPSTITKYTNQLEIAIKNYGRTPAHRMTIHCECSFNTHDPRYKHGVAELLDAEQMLHPGQRLSFPIPTVNEFRPHTSRFYVIGHITYNDIYNNWWITDFCYRYEGDGRFTPYGDQNSERGPFKYPPWL